MKCSAEVHVQTQEESLHTEFFRTLNTGGPSQEDEIKNLNFESLVG